MTEHHLGILVFEQKQGTDGTWGCLSAEKSLKRLFGHPKRGLLYCRDWLAIYQINVVFLQGTQLDFSSPATRCRHVTEFWTRGRGLPFLDPGHAKPS